MKFKGIKNNSLIREIGSIYRPLDRSDWRINLKLQPGQQKESLGVSQLTVLARRRVLNATEELKPAGYETRITIEDATQWKHKQIGDCPIPSVANQEDKDQWCFSFGDSGTAFYLPQIELARVLFFHYGYLSRLAMVSGGLNEEFDVQEGTHRGSANINILPTSSLPKYVRGDHELRRLLAWILLDKEARRSFESIASYQLEDGENLRSCRSWKFHFDPPTLENAVLTVRGHFDQERRAFFVYEIHGLENLVRNGPEDIEFSDPNFRPMGAGKGVVDESAPFPAVQPLIDDDEVPSVDTTEQVFQSSPVKLSFANPAHTTRTGPGSRRRVGAALISEPDEEPGFDDSDVSTDEPTTRGRLPAAGFDAVEDQSDDLHHYIHKFEAFAAMVEVLKSKGCVLLAASIRKLPAVAGFSKFLLEDGNPRCLSFCLLSNRGQNFVLLEVDTSDNKTRLSTLLLKQPGMDFDWGTELNLLERLLVQSSLSWPKKHLEKNFSGHFKRISHPKTTSRNKTFLEPQSIQHWAERIYNSFL